MSAVRRRGVALAALLACLAGATARAEVPPLSDADLQASAELIVTGFVTEVTERDEVSYPAKGQRHVVGYWSITLHVEAVEKGRLSPGQEELRFSGERNLVIPKGWVGGTDTLRLTPMVGDDARAFLVHTKAGSESAVDGEWRLFHHHGLWLRR